ncbi:unnamed protein product [Clavelina lepadiformis]|uniref:Uncharacterized protein n=1 Tax=Clavelina lepadiformis TaxID=159417 RepID=A0ABP0G183_CLALP
MCHKLLVMLCKYLNSDRQSTILLLEKIWGQVKQNTLMLQSLHRRFVEGQIPSTSSVEDFNLPIGSFEDFDRVESLLAEKSQASVLQQYRWHNRESCYQHDSEQIADI